MILHTMRNLKFNAIVFAYASSVLLSGCGALNKLISPPPAPVSAPAPVPASKSSQLLNEANRLAEKVKRGEMTRLAAADQLNRIRLHLVGGNQVDDAVFASYRTLARRRDEGSISQPVFQSRMKKTLLQWQQRWPTLARRPADPAFTNLLMQLYGLPLLK
jgi:hypothetical protein